jgi:hypothetical protein
VRCDVFLYTNRRRFSGTLQVEIFYRQSNTKRYRVNVSVELIIKRNGVLVNEEKGLRKFSL